MNAVDEFVVYDNIQYTKKGWINRNRILVNGKDTYMNIPLKNDSDYLDVRDRYLAGNWELERKKLLNKIKESYRKAPYYETAFEVFEMCVMFDETNLFKFIFNSLKVLKKYLQISTNQIVSSTVPINHNLKAEEKVIAISKARQANTYINPIGGTELYNKDTFEKENIKLCFLKGDNIIYKQFDNEFIPSLSILDVMMFNSIQQIQGYLNSYNLF